MNSYHRFRACAALVLGVFAAAWAHAGAPDTILMDGDRLQAAREAVEAEHPVLAAGLERLRESAESRLGAGPWSVVDKEETPPSGDKRDYMSQGPFWWPNPDTDDGLPYVRRDGERNPEADALDRRPLGSMASAVQDLALAYFFTGEEAYAERAAYFLRVWFLDEDTAMNPHLRFGQRIPGRTDGRGIGIIDTVSLARMVDCAPLLTPSDAWSGDDHAALQAWFREYRDWLLESDLGQDERVHPNNHGTWYDVQAAAFSLFVDDEDTAREILGEVGERRVATQIEPSGQQPLELERAQPFHYSSYNLDALIYLAELGAKLDVDVWGYEPEDGGGIPDAVEYLVGYLDDKDAWDYEGIQDPAWGRLMAPLRRVALLTGDARYEEYVQQLAEDRYASLEVLSLRYPWLEE